MHLRQAIIAEFVARIYTGVPALQQRVYASRVSPIEVLPAAVVYSDGEAWDGSTPPGPVQFRELTVTVDLYAKANTALEAALDQLAASCETHISKAGGILWSLAKLVYLESSTPELVDDLEQPAGRLRMNWQVLYRVDTRAPEIGPAP